MHVENFTKQNPGKGRVGKSGRLTRERVVKAGWQVAQAEGIERLTMKRVAQELEAAVMSLYYHVRDRDDLIDALIEAAADQLPDVPEQSDPLEELMAVFGAIYETFRKFPWVARCLMGGHPGSTKADPLVERAVIALERIGMQGADAGYAFGSLLHYTFGEVIVMDSLERGQHFDIKCDEVQFPAIARTIGQIDFRLLDADPYYRSLRRILVGYDRRDRQSD